ncbi:35447_t:CDS:1, partial [Racocetra persica]
RKTGIYLTWDECKAQVNKFRNAMYKKFPTRTEAQNFIEGKHEVSVILNDNKIQILIDGSLFNNAKLGSLQEAIEENFKSETYSKHITDYFNKK